MGVLQGLYPEKVFEYFEELCAIPHASGNTGRISDYCVNFARKRGLFVLKDGLNNVIIKKPASAGYENRPSVILQGHLDMVCEKMPDCDIDFEKDGLRLKADGDFIYAEGTSLGGDDASAIAMALAVLDDDSLEHPAIEAVFTVDEEIGMYGAEALDTTALCGNAIINIDSEEAGILTVSCAGGAGAYITMPVGCAAGKKHCRTVKISGLAGGHSGTEINKGRLNAIKLMGEFLGSLGGAEISGIRGGGKDNVIPSECLCDVFWDGDTDCAASEFLRALDRKSEESVSITVSDCGERETLGKEPSEKLISLINKLPNGVIKMSGEIENLVQTSLNLGIISVENGNARLCFSVRSSVNAEKDELISRLEKIAVSFGGSFSVSGCYPAWEYRKESHLRDTMVEVYKRLFGHSPVIQALHAGLECGIFAKKIKDMDAVSFGPDIFDIHSVKERLSVSSTAGAYRYLCEILKSI